MGTIAARSLAKMLEDGKRAAAILSMALCQGYALAEARGYHIHLVPAAEGWLLRLREGFTPLAGDRPMDAGIDAMRDLIFGDREALSNVCR